MSPLVEIGLTDLPKSGGVMAPPALTPRDDTPGIKVSGLNVCRDYQVTRKAMFSPYLRSRHRVKHCFWGDLIVFMGSINLMRSILKIMWHFQMVCICVYKHYGYFISNVYKQRFLLPVKRACPTSAQIV